MPNDKPFRAGVVGVFINDDGLLLLGRRFGTQASWQFPQGGTEDGESAEEALHREMREEIGCSGLTVLRKAGKPIRYFFPPTLKAPIADRYQGQDLSWFLCKLVEADGADLTRASDKEFDALRWASPEEALAAAVPWKAKPYREGLHALGINLKNRTV